MPPLGPPPGHPRGRLETSAIPWLSYTRSKWPARRPGRQAGVVHRPVATAAPTTACWSPNHGRLDERHSRTTFPAAQMRPPLTISPRSGSTATRSASTSPWSTSRSAVASLSLWRNQASFAGQSHHSGTHDRQDGGTLMFVEVGPFAGNQAQLGIIGHLVGVPVTCYALVS